MQSNGSTRRLKPGDQIVVASHNAGKVREIIDLVRPFGLKVFSAGEVGLAEPAETANTFGGNAEIKAKAAAERSNLPSLSDDSGLEVDVLEGAPGIFSARLAGPEKDFMLAMKTIAKQILDRQAWSNNPGPRANFTCALTLAFPDGEMRTFVGKVHGHLVWPPRGERGFGYDPMFVPEGHSQTFGEMEPDQKHAMSHRAIAFEQFVEQCLTQP